MVADAAGGQRMVVRQAAAARERREHGRLQPLGEPAHLVPGARSDGAAAGDDQRPLAPASSLRAPPQRLGCRRARGAGLPTGR